jgi:hypothetical protein
MGGKVAERAVGSGGVETRSDVFIMFEADW